MRFALLVLTVLLVGGGVAYLLSGSDPAAPTEGIERGPDGSDQEPREPVVLQGRGDPTALEERTDDEEEEAAGDDEDVVPEALPTRRLEGLVTDERDVPVAGVPLAVARRPHLTRPEGVVSDADGRFVFPTFPADEANLQVSPGEGWLPVPFLRIAPDQTYVHVRLERGSSMRIVVLDAEGVSAPGIRVEVAKIWPDEEATSSSGAHPAGEADDQGVYVAHGLPPHGRIELHVGGGTWPDIRLREIPVGPDDLVLRLPPPAVLEGVLVDEYDKPLGNIQMAADGCDPRTWHMNRKTTTHAATGRFRFEVLAPGRYRLDVTPPPGYAREHAHRFVHAPMTDMRVQVVRQVTATGIVEAEDPTAVGVLWCADGTRKSETPDTDGRFTYDAVPNLPGTLYAWDEASGDAYVLEGVRPGEGPFRVRLQPAQSIEGRVPGFSATRHAGILIGARRGLLLIEGKLKPDDTFVIGCVPPGLWTIQLWEDGGCIEVEDVASGTTDVVVPLPSPPEDGGR